MHRAISSVLLSLFLVGCGGDDDGGGAPEPKSSCSIAVTLTGDVQASFSAGEDPGCSYSTSFDSGIDVSFLPDRAITGIDLSIANVTEGQTGSAFLAAVGVTTEDFGRYETSLTGCTVAISEHRLERTETLSIGEQRHYQVAGTGSCSESAVPVDMMGQITLSEFSFRTPAAWAD